MKSVMISKTSTSAILIHWKNASVSDCANLTIEIVRTDTDVYQITLMRAKNQSKFVKLSCITDYFNEIKANTFDNILLNKEQFIWLLENHNKPVDDDWVMNEEESISYISSEDHIYVISTLPAPWYPWYHGTSMKLKRNLLSILNNEHIQKSFNDFDEIKHLNSFIKLMQQK